MLRTRAIRRIWINLLRDTGQTLLTALSPASLARGSSPCFLNYGKTSSSKVAPSRKWLWK